MAVEYLWRRDEICVRFDGLTGGASIAGSIRNIDAHIHHLPFCLGFNHRHIREVGELEPIDVLRTRARKRMHGHPGGVG